MEEINIYSDQFESSKTYQKLTNILNINIIPINEFLGKGLVYKDSKLSYSFDKLTIDLNWTKQISYHNAQKYVLRKQILARALGIKGRDYRVFDLTCGTAKDSLLLLNFGAKVSAFERNPNVYSLLLDQFLQLEDKLNDRFSIHYGMLTKKFLLELEQEERPDVLYFDPMFTSTNRKKSALKRKEMVLFDDLVGNDDDSAEYLNEILSFGVKRVVVKRHPKSPELLKGVTAKFEGKNIRYDLYCPIV